MEQRKLIRLGNSSFAISLPKEWVDKSDLKKGDFIFLERNSNGELIVSPEFKRGEEKKIEIDLEKKDEDSIKKNFHAAYTKGYNNVIFKGNTKDGKKIKNILNDYLSFEIIDSNDKEIITKDFFDLKEAKFESFVRRIDNNIREMFDILLECAKKEKIDARTVKEVEEIDKAVNKFYFLCSRIFIMGIDNPTMLNILKMNGSELFNNWWISFHLESLGDGLKYVLKWCKELKPKDKEQINNIFLRLHENYIKSMEAFYKKDQEKASEVLEETKKLKQEIENAGKKDLKISEIIHAFELIRKNIYQNTKMTFYMDY